tara:strand:+ start:52 stop:276 length:225 start_codon:yes stop_codon:yes gene_type:complete
MENYTIEQLGLFITLILGGVGGLFAICFKSRCKTIKCCGCMIERYLSDEVKKARALIPEPQPDVIVDEVPAVNP